MPKSTIIKLSVLVGLVALIGGILGIAQRSASYQATSRILVVPSTTKVGDSISAADTLSRGPITSTFGEVYGSSAVVGDALTAGGITRADAAGVSVSTSVVTDTSVIAITAAAANPVIAERAANAVAESKPSLRGYSVAFRTEQIGTADGTATRTGASTSTLVLVALLVAGVLGVVTAAVLGRVFARVSPPHSEAAGAPAAAGRPAAAGAPKVLRPRRPVRPGASRKA